MTVLQTHLDCPVCHSQFSLNATQGLTYPSIESSEKQALKFQSIYFCPSCEAGIAFPVMTDKDIDGVYEDGDYWQNFKVQRFLPNKNPMQYVMASVRAQFVYQSANLASRKEKIRILDIGGGHGFFGVAAARQKPGVQKYCVVEKDKFFRESLEATWSDLYKDVAFKAVESTEEVEGTFDVVVMSHILEHLNDPGGLITDTCQFLAPGGVLLIEVPYQDYLFKSDVFPHVLFYTSKSMSILCERLGLKVIRMEVYGRSREWIKDKGFGRRLVGLVEKSMYKIRTFLPMFILQKFFTWFYQPSQQNSRGLWLRCLVKKI